MPNVTIKHVSSRIQVWCPYHEEFVLEAHRLEGKWKKRTQMWSFERYQYPKVARVLNRLFNADLKITV